MDPQFVETVILIIRIKLFTYSLVALQYGWSFDHGSNKKILHHLTYTYMYYNTRIPILLVCEVCVRPCRISIISSSNHPQTKP